MKPVPAHQKLAQANTFTRTKNRDPRTIMKRALTLLTALLLAPLAAMHAAEPATDRFGGALSIQREAIGHFRVEQIKDHWMFITL